MEQVEMMVSDGKPWYKSKTLWVNAIIGLLTVIETYGQFLELVFGPATYQIILGVAVIANVILRLVTNQPITIKKDTTNADTISTKSV